MPRMKTENFGGGNYSWIGEGAHGIADARTEILDISTFTAGTHYPNGFFPSGLPVRIDDRDVIRPWADVAGAKLGFLKGDVKTDGVEDANCSVVVRGNIKPAKLPLAFTVPTTAAQPQFNFWS